MSKWTASSLKDESQVRVVGFDLRLSFISVDKQATQMQSVADSKLSFPATLDCNVWPQIEDGFSGVCRNGFNLIDDLDCILPNLGEDDGMVVAFTMPTTLIDPLADTFGLAVPSQHASLAKRNWRFLGYDVVDIRTQSSAIQSSEFRTTEHDEFMAKVGASLNEAGLIPGEVEAIAAAIAFDGVFPEHAPFSPCGVWIRI